MSLSDLPRWGQCILLSASALVAGCGDELGAADGESFATEEVMAAGDVVATHTTAQGLTNFTQRRTVSVAINADLRGPRVDTLFSGNDNGTRRFKGKHYTQNDGIRGLRYGEAFNDSCYLDVRMRDVASQASSTLTYNECNGSIVGDLKTFDLPANHLATGIRVCLNNAETKIKGIELIGGRAECIINPNGTYEVEERECTQGGSWNEVTVCGPWSRVNVSCTASDRDVSRWHERANCQGTNRGPDADWERERNCPAGYIANGIRLNERSGGNLRNMLDGLSLLCHEIF